MGKRFHHEYLFQSRSLSLYFLFSSLAGGLLLSGLFSRFGIEETLLRFPFSATFFVMTFFNSYSTQNVGAALSLSRPLTNFFLLQYFLLLGASFELEHTGPLFMSTLPLVATLFTIQAHWFMSQQEKFNRGASLLFLAMTSYGLFIFSYRGETDHSLTLTTLVGFFLWQVGTIYLANREWLRLSRDMLFKKLKSYRKKNLEGNKTDIPSHPINRERYFFHDVINHTHGINLMLRARVMKNRGLTYEETISLVTEVSALQSLVQDHYGLGHKNIVDNWEWKKFSFLKNSTYNLVENFLPPHQVECFFNFKGSLEEGGEFDPEISFVAFQRIMTNLIKNSAEAKATRVEITFEGLENGVKINVKNDVYRKRPVGYELGMSLARMIQGHREERYEGVGLEAVESLCQEWGGSFQFFIHEGTWVSEVVLPYKKSHLEGGLNSIESLKKSA